MKKFLIKALLKLRWAYFHISQSYTKFYMDSEKTEARFFHASTNSIHSNYVLRDDA